MHPLEAENIVHQKEPGFTWTRLREVFLEERTCNLEAAVGIAFLVVRGLALLGFGYLYPGVEYYLRAVALTEYRLGWLCILLGLIHVYAACTVRYRFRAWLAMTGAVLSMVVVFAFVVGAELSLKPIGTAWLSIGLAEIYLAFRNWLKRDVARVVLNGVTHHGATA